MPLVGEAAEEPDFFENNDFISDYLHDVVVLPGCGERALSNLHSIEEMKEDLPNLESAGVVVSWFINSTSIKSELKPGIEKKSSEIDSAEGQWSVGDYNRENAHKIFRSQQRDPSTVRYGGTMPDSDVLEYFSVLKSEGLQTAFYPFIMIDNKAKDWRGYITGDASEVEGFFHNQYKPFIMHYANLLKKVVNIFYLGSELEGLTFIKGNGSEFPFVSCLVELAADVRAIVGDEVKISYAANWSEYHSCKGGYRPLDALWSNDNINFVGIDYYMPLTDHQGEEEISLEQIKQGFVSGEGMDYWLNGEERVAFTDPGAKWKDLDGWWRSEHWGWNPELNESFKTAWVPESKPIILSEYGFRSMDKTTNQPNIFGDVLPKYSSGDSDEGLQLRAIRAMIEHIEDSPSIESGFCYGWDSRGAGWPAVYKDGKHWFTGHWIDGKIKKK